MARIIFLSFGRRSLARGARCFILGADIVSRMKLTDDGCAEAPGDYLHDVEVNRKPQRIYIHVCDFAMRYASCKMGWRTRLRVAFRMNGKHPMGDHITRRVW